MDLKKANENLLIALDNKIRSTKGSTASLVKNTSIKEMKEHIQVRSSDALYFANWGRGKGKMPPPTPIKKWLKRKGLPISALYPVMRKIGERGTKGKYYFENIRDVAFAYCKDVAEATAEEIQIEQNKITQKYGNTN